MHPFHGARGRSASLRAGGAVPNEYHIFATQPSVRAGRRDEQLAARKQV
ncbi:hypothetical protein MFUM_680024 [Methylacidiphilum fumariolicum SolV]|uniref:Uncharacterized protein n=2 Tax=Candidatus Methylacidiphilum fumarolicum TaxID=591154 RepID=I0JYN8_METFB|nr:conserved protein of unknown function [Candidatus Methylacidiphilum fumarolicum]CCG92357.1 hypothetical protein MFUM_680024 [Methylacidiphilum fumariolicum SolV]